MFQQFTATANQTVFTLTEPTTLGNIFLVSQDGLMIYPTTDYTVSGTSLTLNTGAIAGAIVYIVYNTNSSPPNPVNQNILVQGYDTVQSIIYQAGVEIGLNVTPATNPFQSSDAQVLRLVALLRSAGTELLKSYEWQSKLVIYQLTTQPGDTGTYNLPSDYEDFIDQTGWQQSYFWPLRGPYSAQMWQRVVNYPTTGIYVAFRIQNNQLWLWPQPPPVNIGITFMYKSRGWVFDPVGNILKDSVTLSTDIVRFDWLLVVKKLKLAYYRAIGHDTTAAEKEYNRVWDIVTDQEQSAAPELALAKDSRFPFITGFNSPDTGFGGQPPAGGTYQ